MSEAMPVEGHKMLDACDFPNKSLQNPPPEKPGTFIPLPFVIFSQKARFSPGITFENKNCLDPSLEKQAIESARSLDADMIQLPHPFFLSQSKPADIHRRKHAILESNKDLFQHDLFVSA
jgi:hypothetical protein